MKMEVSTHKGFLVQPSAAPSTASHRFNSVVCRCRRTVFLSPWPLSHGIPCTGLRRQYLFQRLSGRHYCTCHSIGSQPPSVNSSGPAFVKHHTSGANETPSNNFKLNRLWNTSNYPNAEKDNLAKTIWRQEYLRLKEQKMKHDTSKGIVKGRIDMWEGSYVKHHTSGANETPGNNFKLNRLWNTSNYPNVEKDNLVKTIWRQEYLRLKEQKMKHDTSKGLVKGRIDVWEVSYELTYIGQRDNDCSTLSSKAESKEDLNVDGNINLILNQSMVLDPPLQTEPSVTEEPNSRDWEPQAASTSSNKNTHSERTVNGHDIHDSKTKLPVVQDTKKLTVRETCTHI